MANKCRKFIPNIFNKTKCQSCFGSKEQHSAEALENNKASRKMSKCGYLFVAPGYDFSNPLDKTRRWQRRFFVLYDDGELAYSVDENPDTVPQGVVDMNKCTDVKDASGSTSHPNSLAIMTPDKTTYIKGQSKEEIQWWANILVKFPENNAILPSPKRRRCQDPVPEPIKDTENNNNEYDTNDDEPDFDTLANATDDKDKVSRFEVEKVKPKDQPLTYRGVRSMKHKGDKHYQDGLRKSSSLHDLSTDEKEMGSLENSRFLSHSGDRLDSTSDTLAMSDGARLLSGYTNPYATLPRNNPFQAPTTVKPLQTSNKQDSSSTSSVSSVASTSDNVPRRGSVDDKPVPSRSSRTASERARQHRERSASLKTFPTNFTLPKIQSNVGSSNVDRVLHRPMSTSSGQSESGAVSENETDEFKMAKSTEMHAVSRATPPPPSPTRPGAGSGTTKFEETSVKPPQHVIVSPRGSPEPSELQQDLMYMKKGWLIKMGSSEKDWKKHWFVLTGNSLRYYKDAKSEETNALDGRIDLSSCYEITEVQIQRNYGFKIKTRNGEYILSAMTSGIRSNWMKAIRLCMDLQNSNKNKPPSQSADSSVTSRTNDDMEIEAATGSRLSQNPEASKPVEKKDFGRNVRRHYSDVNPGNIGKMFSIKGLTLDSKGLSHSLSSQASTSSGSNSTASSKEPSVERESRTEQKTSPPRTEVAAIPKQGKYSGGLQHAWSGDGIPFRRFVEGSDSHVTPPPVTAESTTKSIIDKKEEETKKRNKSPSVRIKEKSRAKSPKLHSPPPGHEPEDKFSFRHPVSSDNVEEDNISVSSEDMDIVDGDQDHNIDDIHLDADDNMTSTLSSAGEVMLVDLLENEVESLKERLEHTEKELSKSHDSNRDLKSKLQTVVRDKDNSSQFQASIDSAFTNTATLAQHSQGDSQQMNNLKRQLKDAKDTIQRQKTDIDGLKSKLDMSVSKLTGTEKALSEALKDVKVEKDKFLKVTNDYNRKVRGLEGQLREVTQKMEKYHENSLIKDKENRKLDNDLRGHQQLLREHEREILKLKAVEYEYRQMKEKFDETSNTLSRMRIELNEKDAHIKKLEVDFEEQFENMMQEFAKERDATEQHIEDMKNQLLESQRKSNESDSFSSNMADILQEKDEIIAQLEEKMIESESKIEELTEEVKNYEEDGTSMHQEIELIQEEREQALKKIMEVEKSMTQFQNQVARLEKENASIRKHMDDLRKENTDLCERVDNEKHDSSGLVHVNDELKSQIKDLENEVHILHKKLTDVCSSQDRLSVSSDGHTSQELLHTFILATSEVNDISDFVLKVRKQYEEILSKSKGDQKTQLTKIAEMLEDLGRKCDNVSDVLKEGSEITDEKEVIKKEKSSSLESSASNAEVENLKTKNAESEKEIKKLQKQVSETQAKFAGLQSEDNELKGQLKHLEESYQKQIQSLGERVEDIASKSKVKLSTESTDKSKKPIKSKASKPQRLSEQIESQLSALEDQVGIIEKVMYTQDLSLSSIDTQTETEGEDTESDTDDSDGYTDSEEEEETDDETQDDSTVTDGSENLLGKLKEMKHQLELTNNKIKHLTTDISDFSNASGMDSEIAVEGELRQTLIKCGEKIDSLTNRLNDGIKCAKTEVPKFSDSTWAFQKCVNKLKDKVTEVSIMVNEHDEINAKDLKEVQERVRHLLEFVAQVDKLGENDWDIAGKIAKQEMKFQHLLANRERATRNSHLKYEDKLQLYADKLAFEAMILGQMGILIQRQQIGNMYKDTLLREIHEANLQTLELERLVDSTSRGMTKADQDKDLVSSYASILAEKIVLEGQLATGAMVQDVEASENIEILSSLQVEETPSVLATEIFLRSQVDASVNEQLKKLSENMDSVSNHIVTKALLQGEITHALQIVKQKFKNQTPADDLSSLVKNERQFAYDQLSGRQRMILDIVSETEPVIMTTLIQLIEYTQGPTAPTLDSVCDIISGKINKAKEQYQESLQTADASAKSKIEHIISHLEAELEDVITIFREEYQCYVQTASPDIDTNVLKFSADTLAADLAGIFVQKAVIEGTFAYVSEVYMSQPDVTVSNLMEPLEQEGEGLSGLAKSLGQILLTEAANKQALAADVRNIRDDKEGSDKAVSGITSLVGVIPDLEAYPHSFDAYAATLVREAMFQSQLTYTTYKLKLQYHRQLRDIKLKMEAGEKVILPSEISREAESDIQASLTIFEEILDNKSQDESAVLSLLESEIEKLKSVPSEKSCSKCRAFESNLKQLEKSFQHEVSVVQDRQNVHIDVLRQEVSNVILRVDKFLEEHEREKEKLIADYEDRILTLQDEFDIMKIDHEEELEQVKQDIMTAVSAIKASEDDDDTSSVDQLRNHNRQLMKMSTLCKELLTEIKANLGTANQGEHLSDKIEAQLTQLHQIESDPSYTIDLPSPLSPHAEAIPGSPPTVTEAPPLDKSLSAERSDENVDKLLEKSQHEHEMEQLKREKEQALAEEIKITKAALDAMRKAYEEELEQEKEKYRHALKTMFTDSYVEDIRRRHDLESEKIREELKQISMHYESKCEDYKLLEDRLQRTKGEYQTHINQLQKSNEHLTETVSNEIEQLKDFIQNNTKGRLTGNATLEEELYDAQIMVRVKDAELQKLRSQVKNTENSLERITEEQRYTMTNYLKAMKKNQELQAKIKEELMAPAKERKDSAAHDEQVLKNARALRRNPSFHQRARSPSPETSSPRKDTEHHSRESHRRSSRHLTAKDLKRSKSSPILPYVFEAKGGSTSNTAGLGSNSSAAGNRSSVGGASGISRRESGRNKSQKKH